MTFNDIEFDEAKKLYLKEQAKADVFMMQNLAMPEAQRIQEFIETTGGPDKEYTEDDAPIIDYKIQEIRNNCLNESYDKFCQHDEKEDQTNIKSDLEEVNTIQEPINQQENIFVKIYNKIKNFFNF